VKLNLSFKAEAIGFSHVATRVNSVVLDPGGTFPPSAAATASTLD